MTIIRRSRQGPLAGQLDIYPIVQRDALGIGFERQAAMKLLGHAEIELAAVGPASERFGYWFTALRQIIEDDLYDSAHFAESSFL